ncbi:MAG: hypothetical protein IJX00_02805 [Clostridia bacterium]|nr:hypothetical protein [Clostridia bacterium]
MEDKDNLHLYAKKSKLNLVEECYESLGWQKTAQEENKRYEDLVDLSFERPHKINNKDDLQLLQIHMEHHLNKLGRIERRKYFKSLIFGVSLCILGLYMLLSGVLMLACLHYKPTFLALGVGACVVSLCILALDAYIAKHLIAKEKQQFKEENEKILQDLQTMRNKAKQYREVEDERC